MLKSNVGYSINQDNYLAGEETAKKTLENMSNSKLGFLFTSVKNDIKEVLKGVRKVTDTPIIGCTSSGAIMVPDGIISSDNGFVGMMMLCDEDMTIGIACHEAGRDARAIGRKVDGCIEPYARRRPDMGS